MGGYGMRSPLLLDLALMLEAGVQQSGLNAFDQ
jgi:hypothetical protein